MKQFKKFLRKSLMIYLSITMICILTITKSAAANHESVSITGIANYSQSYQVLDKVNELRKNLGLNSLSMDKDLQEIAMIRAAECAVYFSHTRPNGEDCFSILDEYQYDSWFTGENIAIGQMDSGSVFNSWKNSSGHYANMVNSGFSSIGIGCFYHPSGGYSWVQIFTGNNSTNYKKTSIDSKTYNFSVADDYIEGLKNQSYTIKANQSKKIPTIMANKGFPYFSYILNPSSFAYTFTNPNIVSINSSGTIIGEKVGSTTIRVRVKGTNKSSIISITVNLPFNDVSSKDWYYNTIKEIFNLELMSGTDNTHFSPNGPMSRGMVATVLYRMAGAPNVTGKSRFNDVKDGLWYSKAITWASNQGIISGYQDGKFGPDDNVTREQMAVMLRNYAMKKGLDTKTTNNLTKFKDYKNVTSYAKSAVGWAVDRGIISGANNGTRLNPTSNATRAECAKMLLQLYKMI